MTENKPELTRIDTNLFTLNPEKSSNILKDSNSMLENYPKKKIIKIAKEDNQAFCVESLEKEITRLRSHICSKKNRLDKEIEDISTSYSIKFFGLKDRKLKEISVLDQTISSKSKELEVFMTKIKNQKDEATLLISELENAHKEIVTQSKNTENELFSLTEEYESNKRRILDFENEKLKEFQEIEIKNLDKKQETESYTIKDNINKLESMVLRLNKELND